ncbi:MAG: AraC family transcriptional regulator [Clostridiaceae bacterium]|nr:AraC family transcriptional regulator [Eubacteriales bacterium]
MTAKELALELNGELIGPEGGENEVTCGYACDLLSWVMANGRQGCAWVTIQTHMNVVALASLHEMACVIFPEGVSPDEAPAKKAAEEGIALVKSPLTAYEICGRMARLGIASLK